MLLGQDNPPLGRNFFGLVREAPPSRHIRGRFSWTLTRTQRRRQRRNILSQARIRIPETMRDARNDGRRSLGPSVARKALLREAVVRRNEP